MKRYGAVIVFKQDVSKEQAEIILAHMALGAGAVIDSPFRDAIKCADGSVIPAFLGVDEFDDVDSYFSWRKP